jgi:hypothetical protein
MMDSPGYAPPATTASKTAAGITGGGTGTLLITIAHTLPTSSSVRDILIYAAPGVSVSLAALWIWVQRRGSVWIQERDARKALQGARRTLEEFLSKPNTSDAHRERIRSKLEELELADANNQLQRVRARQLIEVGGPEL